MSVTVISFLGKSQKGQSYRPANYDFSQNEDLLGEGPDLVNSQYFGLTLPRRFETRQILLLGTSGSMWDVLLSDQVKYELQDEALLDDLIEACGQQNVTQALLDRLQPELSRIIGVDVCCLLIDNCRDAPSQMNLLRQLSEALPERADVVLDVTHSYRHLPMLGLVAARFLARTRGVRVRHILYGALDMTQGEGDQSRTPVLDLGGMLTMLDWVDALASYDKDADYSVFAPLLEKDGLAPGDARMIREAAFQERCNNAPQAQQRISTVSKRFDQPFNGVSGLFAPELKKRLNWFRQGSRARQELALSRVYGERHDAMRSTIFLFEAWVSAGVLRTEGSAGLNNPDSRQNAADRLKVENSSFAELSKLRNAFAHGKRAHHHSKHKKMIDDLLKDESVLLAELDGYRKAAQASEPEFRDINL